MLTHLNSDNFDKLLTVPTNLLNKILLFKILTLLNIPIKIEIRR